MHKNGAERARRLTIHLEGMQRLDLGRTLGGRPEAGMPGKSKKALQAERKHLGAARSRCRRQQQEDKWWDREEGLGQDHPRWTITTPGSIWKEPLLGHHWRETPPLNLGPEWALVASFLHRAEDYLPADADLVGAQNSYASSSESSDASSDAPLDASSDASRDIGESYYSWPMSTQYGDGSTGHYLAVNLMQGLVLLSPYETRRDYFESQTEWRMPPDCHACSTAAAVLMPCGDFAAMARLQMDPGMLQQPAQSTAALSSMYIWYHMHHLQPMRKSLPALILGRPVRALARWRSVQLSSALLRSITKVQAAVRGWLWRHCVLYNPETQLGQRYLLRQWHCLADDFS